MPRRLFLMLVLSGFCTAASFGQDAPADAGPISEKAKKLDAVLGSMNVEKLWKAGVSVNWQTGESTGKKGATHCSAFAASVCEKLDIYLLRPPEHGQTLLANAQTLWLNKEGAEKGWKKVSSPFAAQKLANEGEVVVAALKNPDAKKPGHIAIVRPSAKSTKLIDSEGPDIIQAGRTNYERTSVKEGFKNHPDAWEEHQIEFFSHAWTPK